MQSNISDYECFCCSVFATHYKKGFTDCYQSANPFILCSQYRLNPQNLVKIHQFLVTSFAS